MPIAMTTPPPRRRPNRFRSRAAVILGRSASRLSCVFGRGRGSMIGGHVARRVDPGVLEYLGSTRDTVLVTGTNGKSTTSRLLAVALAGQGPVATGVGANRIPGLVAALADAPPWAIAALETREAEASAVIDALRPAALILLNLSSDVDADTEAFALERDLRTGLAAHPGTVLVANCDDVLVSSIAYDALSVVWVAAGVGAEGIVRGCPRCTGLIVADAGEGADADHPDWRCSGCAFRRPAPDWSVEHRSHGAVLCGPDGFREALTLQLPGAANRGNAAQAIAAAAVMGVDPREALRLVAGVRDMEQRFSRIPWGDHTVRLLLGKNPVAAQESVSVVDPDAAGVVAVLNERSDNARDTAWVWDVDYSGLGGNGSTVVACGDRAADLSVRLTYDGVAHAILADPLAAIRSCPPGGVDVLVPGVDVLQALEREVVAPRGRPAGGASGPRRARTRSLAVSVPAPPPVRGAKVAIGLVLPETLAASGDRGNALVLRERLRLRGYDARIVPLGFDEPVPGDLDVYVLGGHETDQHPLAVDHLRRNPGLVEAIANHKPVLAVRAGAQILGRWYEDERGQRREGLGVLDVTTVLPAAPDRPAGGRSAEVLCSPLLDELALPLSGLDAGARVLVRGPGARPLARVLDDAPAGRVRYEGAVQGPVIATFLQGPVLARTPELADLLVARALGVTPDELGPLEIEAVDRLRAERLVTL